MSHTDALSAVAVMASRLTRDLQGTLDVLEAGCGENQWDLLLPGRSVRMVGIDLDAAALKHRSEVIRDLDVGIVADIRDADAADEDSFDIIYSSYVLEHVAGAGDSYGELRSMVASEWTDRTQNPR